MIHVLLGSGESGRLFNDIECAYSGGSPTFMYPLVISYTLRHRKWPSRNLVSFPMNSMVDLSSSQTVNVYRAGYSPSNISFGELRIDPLGICHVFLPAVCVCFGGRKTVRRLGEMTSETHGDVGICWRLEILLDMWVKQWNINHINHPFSWEW